MRVKNMFCKERKRKRGEKEGLQSWMLKKKETKKMKENGMRVNDGICKERKIERTREERENEGYKEEQVNEVI